MVVFFCFKKNRQQCGCACACAYAHAHVTNENQALGNPQSAFPHRNRLDRGERKRET